MKIIISTSNFASFNLATEEYLFRNYPDDIFYLYINSPAIIVGRKQNTLAEINYEYVKKNQIQVVRRLSGGGAVYHDRGNLNFCFIVNAPPKLDTGNSGADSLFYEYTKPIIDVLHSLGVNAQLSGRNDITLGEQKISGNAKYMSNEATRLPNQKRILQHGTLLFNSDLSTIASALKVDEQKFNDKAIKSVRSRVTNIVDHLTPKISLDDFKALLINKIVENYQDTELYYFTSEEIKYIEHLVDTKYNTWNWNFGVSPEYNFSNTVRTPGGSLHVVMNVQKGIINSITIYGDYFSSRDIDDYEQLFINQPHNFVTIEKILATNPPEDSFINISKKELLQALGF